jgi:hypothetical protein
MFKLTNENIKNRDVIWKMGLNEDIHPFNTEFEVCAGGIHFCSKKQIARWCYGYTHICDVEIPKSSQVHHYCDKSKASKLIIKTHVPIGDHHIFDDPEFTLQFVVGGGPFHYVKNQTTEICMAAVKQNGYALEFVKEQTPEICMAAMKQDGLAVRYIKEQTHELCIAAVEQNGHALKYLKEQTHELCMAAVEQNGYTLQFVKEQTPEICMAAVKQYGPAFEFINT